MAERDEIPEPDRVAGAPHPRETPRLFGQARAEAGFLEAWGGGRLHHGWLISGPRGTGKATLAWRIARALLAAERPFDGPAPATLDIPANHPVARRLLALSEPRAALIRRPWDDKSGRLREQITVEEIRRLRSFFQLSAADGGARVAIVDAADEMNPAAANALLKLLEEPPTGAVILLVAHRPGALLPTIRSRCRMLRLAPLAPAEMAAALAAAGAEPAPAAAAALAALSGGSVGEALRLVNLGGLERYAAVLRVMESLPRLDRGRALALAESVAGRDAGPRFDLVLGLIETFLARLALAGVAGPPADEAGPGEAALLARLAPDARAGRRWAEAQATLGARARAGRAVNLDPAALVMDMVLGIAAVAPAPA